LGTRWPRRIFGPKKEEVTEACRKLHIRELLYLYSSPNIIKVIKLKRMRWVGHVTHKTEIKNSYTTLVGKPEEITWGDLGMGGKIILR
jgi:hypothetical protein